MITKVSFFALFFLLIANPILQGDFTSDSFSFSFFLSCPRPPQGPPGPAGAQGPAGPEGAQGPAGPTSFDNLYNYNDAGILTPTIAGGEYISFNQTAVVFGSSISQTDDTTFMLNETGNYYVSFTGSTSLMSALGGVRFEVNGTPVGPTSILATAGTQLALQSIIEVPTAPVTLRVIVTGTSLRLDSGNSATISIIKVASY